VKCGIINCYVQGDLAEKSGKTVFLTVHDMGTNRELAQLCELLNELLLWHCKWLIWWSQTTGQQVLA
jgi:hypothetical protein